MTVDLSAQPVVITIDNGTDTLNVSSAYQSLSLESGVIDDRGLHSLAGTLTLHGFTGGYAESFDCRANPDRWKPGNEISVTIGGIAIPTRLKVLEFPSRPTPQNTDITIRVGSDLDLYNYRQPEGSAGGVSTFGNSTDRSAILTSTLAKNGLALGAGQALTDYPLTYPPQKTDGDSWVAFGGKIARTAGHMLWQNTAGDIDITEINLDSLTPVAHYTVGVDEGDFELQSFDSSPPETVRVVGTGFNLTQKNDDGSDVTETVNGVETRTITTFSGTGTSTPSRAEEIQKPRNVILPNRTTDTAAAVDIRTTVDWVYSSVDGKLESMTTTVEEPKAKVHPEFTGVGPFDLVDSTITTVTYVYDSDDIITRRNTNIQKSIRLSSGTIQTQDYQFVRERWTKKGDTFFYSRNVTTDSAFESKAPVVSQSSSTEPPATQYQPSAFDKEEIEYNHETTFQTAVSSGFGQKNQIMRLTGGLTRSNAQCQTYAELEGRLRHGRQFSIAFVAPLTSAWLSSYSPVRRVDFTLNSARTAYLVEGFNIQSDARSTFVGGTGVELGVVNADGTGTPAPAYSFT